MMYLGSFVILLFIVGLYSAVRHVKTLEMQANVPMTEKSSTHRVTSSSKTKNQLINPKIIVRRLTSKLESNLNVMMNIGQIINHPSKLTQQQQYLQQPPNKHNNDKRSRRNDPDILCIQPTPLT